MNLLTLDEARSTVARSALRLLDRCDTTDPAVLHALLFGVYVPAASVHDQRLTRRHRRVLDHVTALGYGDEASDELDGLDAVISLDATVVTLRLED